MTTPDTGSQILDLERKAVEILDLKSRTRPRRPILIEFCGSPKAGKSSCMSSLNIFLKRNGFSTRVLTERASVCPINNKFDPLFNVWTTCSAIAEITEFAAEHSKDTDIIMSDRGIFDGLCWFQWLHEHKHLTSPDHVCLETFLTMPKWRQLLDLIYVFRSSPKVSMEREYATLLTRKEGSIMNTGVLQTYNDSITHAVSRYRDRFRCIKEVDTTDIAQNDVSFIVTTEVLEALLGLVSEQIGYCERSCFSQFESRTHWRLSEMSALPQLSFDRRDEVEADASKVQMVPVLTITNPEQSHVLVLKKKDNGAGASSPEKDRLLLYAGGHIRREDLIGASSDAFLDVAKRALVREIKEELDLSVAVDDDDPFFIWDKQHPRSQKHIAVCFTHHVDFSQLRVKLDAYEFTQKSARGKSGRVLAMDKVVNEPLEQWSTVIVQELYGRATGQRTFTY